MKLLIIIPDGASDRPLSSLGGKTPLEVGRLTNLNYFAKIGKVGTLQNLPDRAELAAYAAFASLMGYEPKKYPVSPGPLEAANMEIRLEENEVAFQMNFVTEAGGVLADHEAGNISTRESRALIAFLNKKLASDFVRFFPGKGHQHLAVIKDGRGFQALSARCAPPEAAVGKKIQSSLPSGPGQESLTKLIFDSKLLLQDHEINQVRLDLGENPANMIWLWGQGSMLKLPKFSDCFGGLTGASISTVELVKGFSRLIGLTVTDLALKQGEPDFDYGKEAAAIFELFQEKEMVCVHLKACDAASREGDVKRKVMALEHLDQTIVQAARTFYEQEKNSRVLIAPLYTVSSELRTRVRDPVPFIVAGKNVVPDEIEFFNETTARVSPLRFRESWKLMELLIGGKELN